MEEIYGTFHRTTHSAAVRQAIADALRQLADDLAGSSGERLVTTSVLMRSPPTPRVLTIDVQVNDDDYQACVTITEEAPS